MSQQKWQQVSHSQILPLPPSLGFIHRKINITEGWPEVEWEGKAPWAQAWCFAGGCYTQLTPAHSKAANRSLLHGDIPSEELLCLSHVSEKDRLSCLKDTSDMFQLITLFCANLLITTTTIHWNKSAFTLLPCTICLCISMRLGQDAHEETVCRTHGGQQKSLMVKEAATHWPPGTQRAAR